MSLEKLLNYSVDNTVINHYLYLLAERDIKAAQIQADLTERLRLSDEALVEVHKTLQANLEEASKQLLLCQHKLANTLNDLEETQQQLERIKDDYESSMLEIERLQDEVNELELSATSKLKEDASNLLASMSTSDGLEGVNKISDAVISKLIRWS